MVGDIKKLLEAEQEHTVDSKDGTHVETNGATNGGKFESISIQTKLYG